MQRCIELALLGAGSVAPNPMVGAVLVHNGRIIGEGYHMQYGQAHAEVNCINAVAPEDKALLPFSTLYVSLEPCAHHGKTPPCADLIIARQIPSVVIGCRDPFKEVDGRGIEKLKTAGVQVTVPVMEAACMELNRRFMVFHLQHRPYIILKWAQTANGFIAGDDQNRLLISNAFSNRLVHQWRSEEAAILVGTNTALHDDPSLTTRWWKGKHAIRLVLDMNLRLPAALHLFDGSVQTIVFNGVQEKEQGNVLYYRFNSEAGIVQQLCEALYRLQIQSVLVEGGARLIQSFMDEKVFDEVRIITNTEMAINKGLPAPFTKNILLYHSMQLQSDTIRLYKADR